ncbi:MAG: transglycosylase SLT domain-containing protein [Bacteroidales bacterium]|nr:transglycosylase SLT domain-containing protein [Bacteroidales bacterium]
MKAAWYICILLSAIITIPDISDAQNRNPQIPEYIYQSRMAQLDKQTPIKLEYNAQVRAYIDVYLERRREHLANIIGRSELYFPIFEEYLSKYNLPQELKYLAIIESALDPKAKSKSGAMGLWQFLYHAGLMLDLKVTSYEDDRCDPYKATDAACRYLAYLYQNLEDWQLALAAYNGGIGTVQKAIERAGGKKSFWELAPYMTDEMKAYVPAFIAVNYVMNYYDMHNIVPNQTTFKHADIDTVYVNLSISFDQLSRATGVERQNLQQLNPQYIKDYIPYDDMPMMLVLPKTAVSRYIKNESKLKPDAAPDLTGYFGIKNLEAIKSTYIVQKGDYLHKIAMRYNTTAEQIMEWNNMTTKDIKIGQALTIMEYREISPYFFIAQEKIKAS